MKILIACEESQVVTIEFRKRGHEAYSCDILPCSGGHPEWHLQKDVTELLKQQWGMIIAFPPCTHLSAAGAPGWKQKQLDGRQQSAIDFFMLFVNNTCSKIAIENPTGIMSRVYRKPDQIINPYQFGDPFKKRTCLWLKGLPLLMPTNIVEPTYHYTSNSTQGGLLKNGTRKKSELPIFKAWDSAKERSKTFQGIANAMAEQWGNITEIPTLFSTASSTPE
jgi:site-specific DNA-cytosine methylase